MLSTIQLVNKNDPDIMSILLQFCTNLLMVGVVKQIQDKHAPIQEIFKVILYYNQYITINYSIICIRIYSLYPSH